MAPSSPRSFRLGLLSAKHSRPGRRRASTWSRSLSAPATSSGPSPCHLLCAPRGPQNALSKNNSGVFFPKDPAVPPGEKEPASAGYPRPSPPGEPCTAPWGQPHLFARHCPGASLPRLSRRAPPHLALSATPPPRGTITPASLLGQTVKTKQCPPPLRSWRLAQGLAHGGWAWVGEREGEPSVQLCPLGSQPSSQGHCAVS